MLFAPDIFRLIIGIATGITGTTLNSLIPVVNFKDWQKGIPLSSCDLILSFIGLTNVFLQIDITLDTIFNGFKSYIIFAREVHLRILNVAMYLISCNCWLTVCLSTYYCLRIVNFTSGLLFILKMRISMFFPKLLVILVIESFCITVPSLWNMYLISPQDIVQNTTSNYKVIFIEFPYMVTMMVGIILPLILTLIPTGITLHSLWRHIKKMKKNMSDSCYPRTQAHVTAARTMVLLVTLHMTFYAASISLVMNSMNVENVSQYFCWYFIIFYSTIQAIVIITGNSKLKRAAKLISKYFRN